MLQTFSSRHWDNAFSEQDQQHAIKSLESGELLFFPDLAFELSPVEQTFLSPDYADPQAKNISYHAAQNKLWGVRYLTDEQHQQLKSMLARFAQYSFGLIEKLLPHYVSQLVIARTSFRPVQVSNRKTSYRKDDKRLHVDAFPSAPNQGKRILRVFCNVNPHQQDRVWRIGEPFSQVSQRFLPQIKKPLPGSAALMRLLQITKSYRTLYDHYMLQLHNRMKADDQYQKDASQQEIRFPSGSTWIVQTDQVSHAAMQGQFLLEQTFYLPVSAMLDESQSPLRILENMLQHRLI